MPFTSCSTGRTGTVCTSFSSNQDASNVKPKGIVSQIQESKMTASKIQAAIFDRSPLNINLSPLNSAGAGMIIK